jgi:hypothetical protein
MIYLLRWAVPLLGWFYAMLLTASSVMYVEELGVLPLGDAGFIILGALLALTFAMQAYESLLKLIEGRLSRWADRRQTEIMQEISAQQVDVPIVCASVARDEAATWLRSLATVGELPHTAWAACAKTIPYVLGICLAFLLLAVAWGLATDSDAGAAPYLLFSMYGLLPLLALMLVLLPLMGIVPWVIRGNAFVFGGEGVFHNLLVGITAVECPPNASNVTHIIVDVSGGRGLRHSRLYADKRFIASLTEMLEPTISTKDEFKPHVRRCHPNS